MRNLAEPGARFRAAARNHPEALLEEPQAFQAVGEQTTAQQKKATQASKLPEHCARSNYMQKPLSRATAEFFLPSRRA